MKIFHKIMGVEFDINLYDFKISSEHELKLYICGKLGNVYPDNIKFIHNGQHITGNKLLQFNKVQFIVVPIICKEHTNVK